MVPQLRLHSPVSIPGLGSSLTIYGDDVTIGRDASSQIVIPETSLSSRHARIQRKPEGWILTDMGSKNGIWVGDRRVTNHCLQPHQLVRIGGVAVEFLDDDSDMGSQAQARGSDALTQFAAADTVRESPKLDDGLEGAQMPGLAGPWRIQGRSPLQWPESGSTACWGSRVCGAWRDDGCLGVGRHFSRSGS